ncbi:hypothetical protein [Roseobacter weihaiensis]|uniref:hypothetical protein n=1 Tax=Roseobacter weihaiensis TaxID=2763262 RepID=UPI001D0B3051|nr:hypothetical protein [Roseobacter sp. H9]
MTAISLINPYAPQPAAGLSTDAGFAAAQTTVPVNVSTSSNMAGNASDQSGQGAGNGTGTGGAQLAALLKRGRDDMPQQPTPKSVIEAQSGSHPATDFLARQAQQQIEAKAAEEARAAERAAARAAEAKADADKAAQPEYVMPNPLPTAPILQREDS